MVFSGYCRGRSASESKSLTVECTVKLGVDIQAQCLAERVCSEGVDERAPNGEPAKVF